MIFRCVVALASSLLASATTADSLALVGGRLIDGFGGPALDNSGDKALSTRNFTQQ